MTALTHQTFAAARGTGRAQPPVESRALTRPHTPRRARVRSLTAETGSQQDGRLSAVRSTQVQTSSLRDGSGVFSSSGDDGEAGPSFREQGLMDYAELKTELIGNTLKLGGFVSLYLGFTQHDTMAFVSTVIGAAGSVAYMALLCSHVDNMSKDNVSAMPNNKNPGENLFGLLGGAIMRIGDVYKNALWHKQLLVPVALAVGCSQWNALDAGPDVLYFDVLIGFFTYKLVVLDQGWKALKKVMFLDKPAPPLPVIPQLNDKDDLL